MKSVEKISFLTYGCKVNQFDTDRIASTLSGKFKIIDDNKSSDLCIVNTCTVTNNSDKQIISDIRKLLHNTPGIVVQDNPETNTYPMPIYASRLYSR